MEEKLIRRQTAISGHVVLFCRYLRKHGFNLTPSEEKDVLETLTLITPRSEKDYINILKATLCKNRYQVANFEDLFLQFKYEVNKAVNSKVKQQSAFKNQLSKQEQFIALKDWLYGNTSQSEEIIAAYSNLEVLTKKEFSKMDEAEIELILNVLTSLVKKIARSKSRLKKKTKYRKQADIRLTIKNNIRTGSDITKLIFSKRKDKRLNIVLLCDVSKSMDLYSKFFIHMLYAFQNVYDRIETFVFSTAIYRISDFLDNHPWDEAFSIISERIPQWSGGTKIGECLTTFYHDHGFHLLTKKTIVMVMSDGWDTGKADLIKDAMSRIQKASRKVIWLNPLSGNKAFSPEVSGLKTALPYIDQLAPAHNLESLKALLQSFR